MKILQEIDKKSQMSSLNNLILYLNKNRKKIKTIVKTNGKDGLEKCGQH